MVLTKDEIIAKHTEIHDKLSKDYYSGDSGMSKAEFDIKHSENWNDMQTELEKGLYVKTPSPRRDLNAEIDVLNARVKTLEEG